ncbi:MAG: 50S ribosomal protein L20 [Candidatus Campbellbacteria bacterium]|nr:50S ribosomal protein L20 [Candidatus Campbellbacteria bacterium]
MTRVKRGTIALKRRRNVLKRAKGFRNTRKSKEKLAKESLVKSGMHAFAHRKDKKNDFRRLWQTRISAAVAPHNISYSKFIGLVNAKKITLNRKMLAEIAMTHPQTFERIVKQVLAPQTKTTAK